MTKWRKMSWAILVWTGLFLIWGIAGAGNVSTEDCVGEYASACEAGTAIGAGIGLTLIFLLWFIGFIVLAIVWFMTRPKNNVTVYGPQGQQVVVSEAEARKRVEKQGWTYERSVPTSAASPVEPRPQSPA